MKITVTNVYRHEGYLVMDITFDHQDMKGTIEKAQAYIDTVYQPGQWTSKPLNEQGSLIITNEKVMEEVLRALFQYRDQMLLDVSRIIDFTTHYLSKQEQDNPEVHDGMAQGSL